MVPTRLGSIDNLSSTRTGSTDNLSGSRDVRWKRSSGPVTGIRIGENLNINQGEYKLYLQGRQNYTLAMCFGFNL